MNRLSSEPSPYLRSAAEQPVDWHPWGKEAFERARREDKPVLLDVGAVWCHWCHVMDRESYEDAETARVLNERFVAVKVDRDERPDVDQRYQKAVQALTGQGGWPLTAFLLPDGRCFYGGTYFPPEDAHGRPSFRRVLASVSDFYRAEKEKAAEQAERIAKALRPAAPRTPGRADASVLEAGERLVVEHADLVHGGWGGAPKFPHTGAVAFALRRGVRRGSAGLQEVALAALGGMARGGVRDHVAGGYHRYSVDAAWIVPHFEKMLYDNAELLRNHVQAFQATGDAFHAEVARDVLRFLDGTLGDAARGGYGGSQDADVGAHAGGRSVSAASPLRGLDDGSHFTWTRDEVEAALPRDLARLAVRAYGLDRPEAEPGVRATVEGRHVLYVAAEPDALAAAVGRPVEDVARELREALRLLGETRARRPVPTIDRTVYVNWSAMAASAVIEAAAAFDAAESRALALRTLDRILLEGTDEPRGAAHRLDERGASGWGLLDDQVQLAWATTEAFVQTQQRRYLDAATRLMQVVRRDFAHAEGAYADTAAWKRDEADAAPLAEPERAAGDFPTPASNAVAAMTHLRLALLTGAEDERQHARAVLDALAPEARRLGPYAGTYLLALDLLLDPPPHVTIVAEEADPRGDALLAAALAAYAPGKAVVRVAPTAAEDALPPEVRGMLGAAGGRATAFVCRGTTCEAPATAPAAVSRLVGKG